MSDPLAFLVMTDYELKRSLEKAWSFIDTEDKWCQGHAAEDQNGKPTATMDSETCRYCAWGSVIKANPECNSSYKWQIFASLERVSKRLYGVELVLANDDIGYEAVRNIFQTAIEDVG